MGRQNTIIITGVSTAGKTTTLRALSSALKSSGSMYRAIEHEDTWERGTVLRAFRKKFHHPTEGWDSTYNRERFHHMEADSFDALLTYEEARGFNTLFVGVHPFVFMGLSYGEALRPEEEQERLWNAVTRIYWLEPIPGRSHERGVDTTVSRYIGMNEKHAEFMQAEAHRRKVPFHRLPALDVASRISTIIHGASNPFMLLARQTPPYSLTPACLMAHIMMVNSMAEELGLIPNKEP